MDVADEFSLQKDIPSMEESQEIMKAYQLLRGALMTLATDTGAKSILLMNLDFLHKRARNSVKETNRE
jgi:hypothetical protein